LARAGCEHRAGGTRAPDGRGPCCRAGVLADPHRLMTRAAIVGLGWWGKTLGESAEGREAISFGAGTSRTLSPEAESFADEHRLWLVESFEALLEHPDVDAVVLATPHSLHTREVVAAAEAGKHVFCEKPFALTKVDAERAVEATRRAGVTLGLGYNRRFHPEMTKLRQKIRRGPRGTGPHA